MEQIKDYLDVSTSSKLLEYEFYEKEKDDLYLDNNIITVSKLNGKIYKKGKVISIDDTNICIKSVNIITINTENYYIFIKKQKYNKNNKNFYKALLNNLS